MGVGGDFAKIQNIGMDKGSFIKDTDGYSAVLGYDLANEEFDRKISNRNTIELAFRKEDGTIVMKKFKVKGIIENSKESVIGGDGETDMRVYIPISVMNDMTGEKDYGSFFAMTANPDTLREVSDELGERFARSFGVPKRDPDDEAVKPYGIFDQADALDEVGSVGDALSSFLFAVAFISLIVGSIGGS